jgi:uncharacterized protein
MTLGRFASAAEFRVAAESFLLRDEAQNNLALGLISTLEVQPARYGSEPYFAVVETGGDIMATALMTPPHRLVLSVCNDASALEMIARDVYVWRSDTPGVIAPAPAAERFSQLWSGLTGQEVHKNRAERLYRLEKVINPAGVPGRLRPVRESDRSLVRSWLEAFQAEAIGETESAASLERAVAALLASPPDLRGAFIWEDPEPVSFIGYGGPTPRGMRIGPVYTPPEQRRRGYASAGTAGVSQWLLDSGRRFVTLFTDLSNPTSNSIYQAIGYEPVCDVDEYRFSSAPETSNAPE